MKRNSQMSLIPDRAQENADKPNETDWDSVIMVGLVAFLSSLQSSVLQVINYPYMKEIDPNTSVPFYGILTSLSQASLAVSSFIYCFWSCKTKKFRITLLTGRVISLVGFVLYLCIELIPSGRRYVILLCHLIFGIADGASSVLPICAPFFVASRYSKVAKRAVFFGFVIGHITGPVVTVAFSPLGYPSASLLFSKLLINAYTCPIWTVLAINITSLVIICFKFKELDAYAAKRAFVNQYSWEYIRNSFGDLRSICIPCCDWYHLVWCGLISIVNELNSLTFMIISAPMIMITFDLSGEETVLILSICMFVSMALSIGVRKILDTHCWKKMYPRVVIFYAIVMILPKLFITLVLAAICSPGDGDGVGSEDVCSNGKLAIILIYMFVYIAMMGVLLPIARKAVSRHCAIILTYDEPLIIGYTTVSRELLLILGPLYASFVYSPNTPSILWLTNFSITAVSVLFLLPILCSCDVPLNRTSKSLSTARN